MEALHGVWLAALIIAGLAGLSVGGGWLCRGAVGVALGFRVRPVVVGLTVVAFATSTPELFTSILAAYSGNTGLVLGNVVGSNIANVGLILGLAALICPLVVKLRLIRRDVPLTIGATFLFCILAWNSLGRLGGVLLLLFLAGYLVLLLRGRSGAEGQNEAEEFEEEVEAGSRLGRGKSLCYIVVGTVLLAIGAELLVSSAVETAGRLGVGEVLIGITLVAVGTSLPELAAALSAALMRQTDLCAGNIVGSNLFNLLLIAGGAALVHPIPVERTFFLVEMPALLLFTVLLWPLFLTGQIVSRREGVLLLVLYGGFLALTWLSQTGGLGW